MKPDKHTNKKITTRHNPYRPKINKNNFNTPHRYSRFIKQFADENDWGFQKIHRWSWTEMESFFEAGSTSHTLKSTYNYTITFVKSNYFGSGKNKQKINAIDDIFLIDRKSKDFPGQLETWNNTGKLTFPMKHYLCLEHHLFASQCKDKSNYLFYTCSPFKPYNLICCDIDDIESDEAYYAVVEYLSSLFPNSYYERSTNGTGLHFYIIVHYDPDRYFFSDVNEGIFRNVLCGLLSEALSGIINDNFAVKFDAIKGTCPLYDINNNFLKYGTLVKLPAPSTYEQFNALYSSSVYSEDYILYVINYLYDFTCRYTAGVYSIDSILSSLCSLLKTLPVRSNPKDFIPELKKESHTVPTTTFLPSTTITNGGSFTDQSEKVVKNRKYTIHDIMNEGDSRVRESLYIKKYIGQYYSQYAEIPDEAKVEKEYRAEMKYHKIGDFRKKRFSKYYQHTVDTFDKDKASDGDAPYRLGMYDAVIQMTDSELTEWVNNNTAYKYKIYRYDLDIALEYIHICSKNKKNRAREMLIKRYAKQEGITEAEAEEQLKNTTPRNGLVGFYKYVSEHHRIDGKKINKCNRKKATALFAMVVEMGLAECIDETFNQGRARKFRLSEAVSQVRDSWNTKGDVEVAENEPGLGMVA